MFYVFLLYICVKGGVCDLISERLDPRETYTVSAGDCAAT